MIAVLRTIRERKFDPRVWQITTLSGLLLYGFFFLHFEISALQAVLMLATVLATQWACTKIWKLPAFDPKSALISGLSLCLLVRTNFLWIAILAAVLSIAMKFVVRVKGKHVFNPTNGAIVACMVLGLPVWVSPGQWGNVAFFAFLMACCGGLVVNRAERSDVTYCFIIFWCTLLFGRSWWIGEPMTIPFHRLESGSLLLFTFFMISDPKTTPDSRNGRILFAALVAYGAYYVQFKMFRTNGLLWSLAGFSMLVPLIDLVLPGKRYQWTPRIASPFAREREPEPAPVLSGGIMRA